MINDPEAEDKLEYYDKVAEYALEYQPIIEKQMNEFDADEDAYQESDDEIDSNNKINDSSFQINIANDVSKSNKNEDIEDIEDSVAYPVNISINQCQEIEKKTFSTPTLTMAK